MMSVTGVILAGGDSKRLYKETRKIKQFINIHNKPMMVFAIEKLLALTNEVIISTKKGYEKQVKEIIQPYTTAKIRLVFDEEIDEKELHGPLPAVHHALKNVKTKFALVIPSDMPGLPTQDLQYLLDEVKNNQETTLASIMNTQGIILSLVFAINLDEHVLTKPAFKRFMQVKQQHGIPLRVKDIIVTAPQVKMFEVETLPLNINTLQELNQAIEVKHTQPSIHKNTKIKVFHGVTAELHELVDGKMSLAEFLKKTKHAWKHTMIEQECQRDLKRL